MQIIKRKQSLANLILWRHAEAEVNSDTGKDVDRVLTKRGQKDALKMAKWLHQHLPANTKILCSPACRCLETVAALQRLSVYQKKSLNITVAEFLGIDSSIEAIMLEVINRADVGETILIIGHQPNLGLLVAKVLGMGEAACNIKKGAVWWLRQCPKPSAPDGRLQSYLFTVQLPRY